MDIIAIVLQVIMLAGFVFVYFKIRKAANDFITAPDNETPSPLAQTIDMSAKVLVSRAAEYFGMHDKAQGSADTRRGNAVDTAMITDLLSGSSPLGAILMTQFPNLAKKLAKNPALMPYILNKLQGFDLTNLGGGNGHTKENPVDFNITKII